MARIDLKKNLIQGKIVYYGPGLCGKTTNLEYINRSTKGSKELVSLATEGDRTIFFDYLPIDLGKIRGISTNFKLYTVPGQVRYNLTRKMVLKNVDGVVFVADSQRLMWDSNIESLQNLFDNMRELRINPDGIPVILQYNKRDLPDILAPEELDKALNPKGERTFLASAMTGEGVLETLQYVLNVVFKKISLEYGDTKKTGSSNKAKPEAKKTIVTHQVGAKKPTPKPPPTPVQAASISGSKATSKDMGGKKPQAVVESPVHTGIKPATDLHTAKKQEPESAQSIKDAAGKVRLTAPAEQSKMGQESDGLGAGPDQASTQKSPDKNEKSPYQSEQALHPPTIASEKTERKETKETSATNALSAATDSQKESSAQDTAVHSQSLTDLVGKTSTDMLKAISTNFATLHRSTEQIQIGQSKRDLQLKQEIRELHTPLKLTLDEITNRLASINQTSPDSDLVKEIQTLRDEFKQFDSKLDGFWMTGTEISNFRGELARLVQEKENRSNRQSGAPKDYPDVQNIIDQLKKELPSKTSLEQIGNDLSFLHKQAMDSAKLPETINNIRTDISNINEMLEAEPEVSVELEKITHKLDKVIRNIGSSSRTEEDEHSNDFRAELMFELSQVKNLLPSKKQLETIESSLSALTETKPSNPSQINDLAVFRKEISETVNALKAELASKDEIAQLRNDIVGIHHQMMEFAQQSLVARQRVASPSEPRPSDLGVKGGRDPFTPSSITSQETEPADFPSAEDSLGLPSPPSQPQKGQGDGSLKEVVGEDDNSIEDVKSDPSLEVKPASSSVPEPMDQEIEPEPEPEPAAQDVDEVGQKDTEGEFVSAASDEDGEKAIAGQMDGEPEQLEEAAVDAQTDATVDKEPADVLSATMMDDASGGEEDEAVASGEKSEEDRVVEAEGKAEVQPQNPDSKGTSEPSVTPKEDPEQKNAKRIARVMVADLELYYSKDVIEGIKTGDFNERMKNQLEEMQKTFESRVSEEVRARGDYLGEAIESFINKRKKELGIDQAA